jgi:sulfur relay (sulfurtransferase) DsrC/TusE family protein
MGSYPSKFETHLAAIKAIRAILADIETNPGRDHPDLKYLSHLIPVAPATKKSESAFTPEFDLNELETEA